MRILVTGSSGFIGKNLVAQLSRDFHVFAPARSELDLTNGDAVLEYLRTHSFDAVVHTATWNATRNSTKDLNQVLGGNLRMFFNLARASKFYGRLLHYGSGAEYDRAHWIPRMREEYFGTHIPADDYGFSKYVISKHSDTIDNIYNLRLFGVFGPHEDWEIRFLSNACCKAAWDLPITIRQDVVFDYVHVDEVIRLTRDVLTRTPRHRTYNLCSGQPIALSTLARYVLDVSAKRLDVAIAREGMGKEYSGDPSRLVAEFGEVPVIPMRERIRDLYRFYETNREQFPREKLLTDK